MTLSVRSSSTKRAEQVALRVAELADDWAERFEG